MNGKLILNNSLFYMNNLLLLSAYTAPIVTTSSISSITDASASGGGDVTREGTFPVKERGVCWNTSTNPTIADNHTHNGSGVGAFSSSLAGLGTSTTYYVRAYATNIIETVYGSNVQFNTLQACTTVNLSYSGYPGIQTTFYLAYPTSNPFSSTNGVTWKVQRAGTWYNNVGTGSSYTAPADWQHVIADLQDGTLKSGYWLCNYNIYV